MNDSKLQLDQWEMLFHAAPCGLIYLGPQGRVRSINRAAARLLEIGDLASACGASLADAVPLWKGTELLASIPSLLSAQTTFESIEFQLPAPEKRRVKAVAAHLPDDDGGVYGVLLSVVECTDTASLERRLQRSEYQASIGKLARGIAHELNSPLDGVMRYTHLALESLNEDSTVREYLVNVKQGLDRMVRAVKAFLEYSRQVTTPAERAADVNRLIDDVMLLVQHRAKFQQVRIEKNMAENLPTVTDAGVQHAFANIIKNAFDVMPKGGTLRINTMHKGDEVIVDIADTGAGIPEEIRSKVFEPFFSTKPIHQGNGLGLVIAKEAVERSGGSIHCSSQMGAGTTFRIHLPVSEGESEKHDG